MSNVTCERCGTAFRVKPSRVAGTRYCSRTCQNAAKRTLPDAEPRPCGTCGKQFTPRRKSPQRRFCSKSCQIKWLRSLPRTPEQNAEYGRRAGDAQRGRGEGKTYRKLYGRHEHRVIAERMLGRPLRRGEIVHHLNGDKRDNRPENLKVMSQGEHMREHGLGIPGMTLHWKPWEHRRTSSSASSKEKKHGDAA